MTSVFGFFCHLVKLPFILLMYSKIGCVSLGRNKELEHLSPIFPISNWTSPSVEVHKLSCGEDRAKYPIKRTNTSGTLVLELYQNSLCTCLSVWTRFVPGCWDCLRCNITRICIPEWLVPCEIHPNCYFASKYQSKCWCFQWSTDWTATLLDKSIQLLNTNRKSANQVPAAPMH